MSKESKGGVTIGEFSGELPKISKSNGAVSVRQESIWVSPNCYAIEDFATEAQGCKIWPAGTKRGEYRRRGALFT